MMVGNAMAFMHQTPQRLPVTLRIEQRGDELAVILQGCGIEANFGLTVEEEEALMRFLIDRCNARPRVPA